MRIFWYSTVREFYGILADYFDAKHISAGDRESAAIKAEEKKGP